MRDVPANMRECGKEAKMRDFPHDCGTVDTYDDEMKQVNNGSLGGSSITLLAAVSIALYYLSVYLSVCLCTLSAVLHISQENAQRKIS